MNGNDRRKSERAAAKEEARQRILRILETDQWPSGVMLFPEERKLLIANARRDGLDL